MHVNAFKETQKTVLDVYNTVALQSMTDAADERQENRDEQGISDVTVSCDGSWQKQGHSSLNGVMTVISSDSGKCLDYCVMTKPGADLEKQFGQRQLHKSIFNPWNWGFRGCSETPKWGMVAPEANANAKNSSK